MNKEHDYPEEVIVRDTEFDETFFLPKDEAKRQEQQGRVIIVKDEKPKETPK
jgi:hypothetical protein